MMQEMDDKLIGGNVIQETCFGKTSSSHLIYHSHMPCPFCEIKNESFRLLAETEHSIAFLSNPYIVDGQTLITPKRHIEEPWQMNEAERKDLFDLVLRLQQILTSTYSTGCDIRENYRPFMKQSQVKIDHIHFHLQPREMEDELYTVSQIHENKLWKQLDEKACERMKKLVDSGLAH